MRMIDARRPGFTLLETMVAATMVAFVLVALGGFIVSAFHVTVNERDRAFATQKALQMMEEVAAYKPAATGDPGVDRFAGGPDFALTTQPGAVPHQALSGNPQVNGFYKYVRQITVAPVTGDPFARQVTVSIWYAAKSALPTIPAGQGPLAVISDVLRATIGTVGPHQVLDVYAISIENLPHVMRKDDDHQFFPSATEARLAFEGGLRQVASMNPGLEFRTHYITRLSIGRDPYYRPNINEAAGLDVANGGSGTRAPLSSVYFYPGRIEGAPDSPRYFDYTQIGGKLTVNLATGDSAQGTYPLADQFNHAVRYAREFDPASGKPLKPDGTVATRPEDMSLRQFLEDLLTDTTGKYQNAILVNLHGELFPSLPLRPWADAAKDPADPDGICQQRRLVTQPYKLYTDASSTVRLLVHPYFDDGRNSPDGTGYMRDIKEGWGGGHYARRGRVIIQGLKPLLADAAYNQADGTTDGTVDENDVKISVVQRQLADYGQDCLLGICVENDTPVGYHAKYLQTMAWPKVKHDGLFGPYYTSDELSGRKDHSGPEVTTDHPAGPAGGMSNPRWSGNDLVIDLADLDYDARKVTDKSSNEFGIDPSDPKNLLHRRQYFPDPYLAFLDNDNTGGYARSTARVLIEFKTNAASAQRLEVVTQLMKSPTSSGTASGDFAASTDTTDPANSRAYCYVGPAGTWNSTRGLYDNVPVTDQVQLVGDPRHNPYLDARQNGLYNPYFSDYTSGQAVYEGVTNTSGSASKYIDAVSPWAGTLPVLNTFTDIEFPNSADSWANVKYNAPAYLRMWREALLRNHMLYVNPVGEPVRFLGLGGEFKLAKTVDGIGDLHIAKTPYDGNSGSNADDEADELFGDRTRLIEAATGTPKWHAVPWLGELYPSTEWATWSTTGNLPAGTYLRKKLSQLDANAWDKHADKTDGKNGKQVDHNFGLPALLNADSGSGPVDLNEGGHGGSRTATGNTVNQALRMATWTAGKTPYAYKISGGASPPEWGVAPYSGLRSPIEWLDSMANPAGYYNHDQDSTAYALNPFLLGEPNGGASKAIVLVDTFRPDSSADLPELAKLMATHMVAAFFDGARNGIGASNIKPLPRTKLKSPATGQSFSIGAGTVPLTWYTKWVKADGQPYSPLHTYDGTLATASGGPLAVAYVIKYRNLTTNGPWTTAQTASAAALTMDDLGIPVDAGVPVTAASVPWITAQPYPTPNTASWTISGLTPGQYLLRVEAYRMAGTTPIPTHYGYHEIPLALTP